MLVLDLNFYAGNAFIIHFLLFFEEADEAFGTIAIDGDQIVITGGFCYDGHKITF